MRDTVHYSDKEQHPGSLISFKQHPDYLECVGENHFTMRVYVLDECILRFRYAIDGYFDNDFSYALDPAYTKGNNYYRVEETDSQIVLKTSKLMVKISKVNFIKSIYTIDGLLINAEEKGFHWEKNEEFGGYIVQMSKSAQRGESFYGLGDKPTNLNLKGKRFMNWGMDEYGYQRDTDPLYKSIPIYYGVHNNQGYGIFFDNTFKAYFDFGSERDNVTSFWAQGGEMNYYFIYGPGLMDVCERYTLLTGTPDLPPLWSLGFQQCKWSYYPESQVMEIAEKMREHKIPCDAIYLDIDYMDGFRCFTWDNEKFPNPKGMVDNLKDMGFQTMVIIDPGIKIDREYSVFQEAMEKGYFCKRVDGPYVEGKVWPGDCYFPDFTRPEVRDWWAGLYKGLIEEVGVAGVWNDMNEPALFEVPTKTFPLDVLHDYDGNQTSHRKAHNIYGMQMARATAQGVKQFRNGERTLIITRSGYSGLQRYSSVWTGDNIASWEHLWLADVQAQRLAISGISFCGSDIGGFIGQPNAEMMIRWIQLGIFHPFCRVHSSGDHGDQEPWVFGEECTDIFRKYVEIRYQLLPYIYTTFYQYHKFGTPMMRPLVFIDQEDVLNRDKDHEFLLGDHILASPVVTSGSEDKEVYLPKGDWYNFWTDEIKTGREEYLVNAPLDTMPIFVRAGAVMSMYPIQQYIGEKSFDTVDLHIYFVNGQETSYIYEDDMNTFDYEKGSHCYKKFEVSGSGEGLIVIQSIEGHFESSIKHYKLKLHGFPENFQSLLLDGEEVELNAEGDAVIPSYFSELQFFF